MRSLLSVALVATLGGLASAVFRGPVAEIYSTWDLDKPAIYVKDFDHLAPLYVEKEVHEEEHSRKKRNADDAAHWAAQANPITKACDRPGYTGQFCEFPICLETNPYVDPNQFKQDDGFLVDIADFGNCTLTREILVDETMGDIRIEIQSRDNVNPRFYVTDWNGHTGTPDGELKEADRYEAHFVRLSPGYYRVTASADNIMSRCLLQTTANTPMTISGGFTADERDRNDYPNRNAAVHQFNSIMVHLNGARSPAELKTISVIGTNNYVFRPRILDRRYGCAYEYYFDSMFCMVQGAYAMIVEGIDFNGNTFRRAATFGCISGPPPPTQPSTPKPTPVPTNPTSCANGGVNLQNIGGGSVCICQDHFTGPQCEQPLCINGGTLLEGKCVCTTGFEGMHCEDVRCEPNSDHGYGVDRPTLVLVVRVREQMNGVMQQVWDAVDQISENLQFEPNYFSRFQVVFFNDYTNFMSKPFNSIEDFNNNFIKATISDNANGGCTDAVIGAVTTGLTNLALTSNSYIYVITDALADDASSMTDALMQYNSYFRATINFIYVEPSADSGCTSDVSDPGFRSFETIANTFGGLAFHVSDRTKVYDVFYNHLNSIVFKSQLMLTVDREECGNGLVKAIAIEKRNENLVMISKGRGFFPLIIDPNGEYLNADALETVLKQDLLTIWRVKNPVPGQYYLRATANPATAACNIRVYQSSYQTPGPAQAEAFWTITTDIDQDGQLYQPISGIDNHPVFHVENLGEQEDWDHAFAFLNMYAWRNGAEKEIYASNGIWRGGCSYHFYFPSFRCRANENIHYEFFVRNDEGFYIQRAGVMNCFNFIPTPAPPDECQNGGVEYNGSCLCTAHYNGDKCQNVVCDNGGTPGFNNQCMCSNGWGGPFCMFAVCNQPGPPPTFGYGVDMAFLVEVTKSGVDQMKQLVTYLPGILRDIRSQHVDWIDRVVLIGYNSQEVIGMVDSPMDSTGKLMDTLSAWANSNPTDDGCVVRVWEAIQSLLRDRMNGNRQRRLPRRSVINIFESSIPDNVNNAIQALSTSEELLETNALTNVFQWQDPSSDSRWRCNGNQSDFKYIEQAARRGDGKMYTLGNQDIPAILRMIPTLFSSSIVYKFHSEDCTAAKRVFFPVDAYTQTISAIVAGSGSSVDLYKYDGSQFNDDGRINIFRNEMQRVVEFRNPCDSGWESQSQYCMYFNANKDMVKSFKDADDYCSKQGAFLVDDLSPEKNKFFNDNMAGQSLWLGLRHQNGQNWAFEHDNGGLVPVPANLNNWDGGKIPDGTTGKCAYFKPNAPNGNWFAADCDTSTVKYHTVCQKHMFDNNAGPSSIVDDDIAPGKYYLTVQTDGENDGWRGCDVEVRVQSALNVEFGFVDALRNDNPHPVANVDSNANRVVSSISIEKGKTDLSILQQVLLRSDDAADLLLEAATESYRFACSYEYYSQPLNCDLTNGDDFSVVHIGEDDTGNTFQRYSTSLCYKWNACSTHGTYSNGACLCDDYWTGDACRTPICQNGGALKADGRSCQCTTGYGGDSCEFPQCTTNSMTQFSNDDKILALVIEKSENTADAIQKLADNFETMFASINDTQEGWITAFVLHTFTSTGDIDDTVFLKSVEDVIAHLDQYADDSKKLIGSCQQPLWDAVHGLFSSFNQFLRGSQVLIITASAPLDADQASVQATMELFDEDAPVVDFIHVETPQCAPADWINGLENFYWFFQNTGGTMFRVQPAELANALSKFVPTRYAAQKLSMQNPGKCQQNTMYVQVSTDMTDVFVMVGGSAASLSVISPLGQQVMSSVVYSSEEQKLWRINPTYPGIYAVTITSNSRICFPTVWGFGGPQVFAGFIQDYNTGDKPLPYAVFGKVNFPVFHLYDRKSGGTSKTETLYMANLYVQSFWMKQGKMFDTDLDARTGCSYEYIGKGFTCAEKDQIITILTSGVDAFNQPFSRESIAWCKDGVAPPPTKQPPITVPTTVPSTTAAPTPKTIQFDVLFIVDETEDASFLKDVAEKFIEKTMDKFTTSQRRARVGLITIPNKLGNTMPVAFLSSIDSFEALDQDLLSLEDFNFPADKDYLSKALSFANDPNKYKKKENGYRAEISNHLIVILTSKSDITDIDDSLKEIDNISKQNSYGIITIGYGNQAQWNDVKKLAAPDCTKIVADKNTLLSDTVEYVQNKIWDAAFNGGMYCAPAN